MCLRTNLKQLRKRVIQMTSKLINMENLMIDNSLDERIKALELELNQLKRARNARRGKARARYPVRQYLSYM